MAGLAAAHDRGVLHRDLKPANVMLDGRGQVRITDFGLAVAARVGAREADGSGTPAYMAPNNSPAAEHRCKAISTRSACCSTSCTGKRAFSAITGGADRSQAARDADRTVETGEEIDPAVERVILRAIASDPRTRPASVVQVAAALPGGSLLEAALRAGETPSPEMVAASGTNEALKPLAAWALAVGTVVAGAALAIVMGAEAMLWRRDALERSPEC